MLSIAGAIGSVPYVAAVAGLLMLYNSAIENPQVRAEARAGMVATAELAAAEAQLAERERQAQAATAANGRFAELLRRQAEDLAGMAVEQEKRDDEYAAKLKAAGRACLLTDADIRELHR